MLNRYYVNESHLPMKYFHLSHSKIIKLLNTAIRHADGYQVRTRDPQTLDRMGRAQMNCEGFSFVVVCLFVSNYVKKKPSHGGWEI